MFSSRARYIFLLLPRAVRSAREAISHRPTRSDHGAVYVFDRKTGKPLEVLHHADKGLVQTITVCECAKYMRS